MRGAMNPIEFVRIQPGYWTMKVGGVTRPIVAVRKGRNWIVQAANLDRQATTEKVHGSTRTLADAKSLMVATWLHLDAMRNMEHYNALEMELARLNRAARALGVTYPILPQDTPLERRVAYVRAQIYTKKGVFA